jgi:hypothetical protein
MTDNSSNSSDLSKDDSTATKPSSTPKPTSSLFPFTMPSMPTSMPTSIPSISLPSITSLPKLTDEEINTSLQKIGAGIVIGAVVGITLFRKPSPNRIGWWITSSCTGLGIATGNIYTRTLSK